MIKTATILKDLVLGKPEQRFKDITTTLENIQSRINLKDKQITNLLTTGNPKLSEEQIRDEVSKLNEDKTDLENKIIEKRDQLKDVQKEYTDRKVQEQSEASIQRQNAYVENTGKQAKTTAKAIAEAKIAVRKARLAMRNRTRSRAAGGKRKSQKKRRTTKRK
jgi:single-stranded DNA-specific DHH superfamily exonuclease